MSVKPGTLDDPSQLAPRYEGWTKRKVPWLVMNIRLRIVDGLCRPEPEMEADRDQLRQDSARPPDEFPEQDLDYPNSIWGDNIARSRRFLRYRLTELTFVECPCRMALTRDTSRMSRPWIARPRISYTRAVSKS